MTLTRFTLMIVFVSFAAVYAAGQVHGPVGGGASAPVANDDAPGRIESFSSPAVAPPVVSAAKSAGAAPEVPPAVIAPVAAAAPEAAPSAGAADSSAATGAAQGPEQVPEVRTPPARQLFGAVKSPSPLAARAIGSYAKGCLAGARPLAVDGDAWQAMRLSRNRNWGHPELIALVERFAAEVKANDGWPGILVGDISQPRGGPMLTGHASHQIGLDADIWLTPMPDRRLSEKEREDLAATSMLADDQMSVNAGVWTASHAKILQRAASYSEVERVLVHPAIKLVMCTTTGQGERPWLAKIRPYWGHHYHFHIRMRCPKDSTTCEAQSAIPGDDGCGQELVDWYKRIAPAAEPKEPPAVPAKPAPPKREIMLGELPNECRMVLGAEYAGESKLNSGKALRPVKKSSAVAAGKAGAAKSGVTAAAK